MAEGGGLLNRYTLLKAYRGFESLRLRQPPGPILVLAGNLPELLQRVRTCGADQGLAVRWRRAASFEDYQSFSALQRGSSPRKACTIQLVVRFEFEMLPFQGIVNISGGFG